MHDGRERNVLTAGPFAKVWALVRRIPRGRVATYGQLSDLIARRLTPVGVGWALRAEPDRPIPWHRVVNGRGGISTEGELPGVQRGLLEREGIELRSDGTVDLGAVQWKPRRPRR